jgi:hypothetical protein
VGKVEEKRCKSGKECQCRTAESGEANDPKTNKKIVVTAKADEIRLCLYEQIYDPLVEVLKDVSETPSTRLTSFT